MGNDCEKSRTTVDCIIDERALRELYLVPFECVVQAGAWTMMAAYNRVNGVHATEHRGLIRGLLKGEWDWDGVVLSDWFAAHDTVRCALAGLDLEMPAGQVLGVSLADAVRRGSVPESELDDKVERLRRLAGRVRRRARPASPPDEPRRPSTSGVDAEPGRSEAAALLTRAAAAGFVLMKNADGVLPLELDLGLRTSPSSVPTRWIRASREAGAHRSTWARSAPRSVRSGSDSAASCLSSTSRGARPGAPIGLWRTWRWRLRIDLRAQD